MGIFSLFTDVKISLQILKIDADNETINGAGCDMAAYKHVAFIAGVLKGEIKTNSLKVQQDTAVGYGTAADLAGTSIDLSTTAGADGFAMAEVKNVQKRYVRPVMTIANWSTPTCAFCIAIQWGSRSLPETNTGSELHVAPAEGTA